MQPTHSDDDGEQQKDSDEEDRDPTETLKKKWRDCDDFKFALEYSRLLIRDQENTCSQTDEEILKLKKNISNLKVWLEDKDQEVQRKTHALERYKEVHTSSAVKIHNQEVAISKLKEEKKNSTNITRDLRSRLRNEQEASGLLRKEVEDLKVMHSQKFNDFMSFIGQSVVKHVTQLPPLNMDLRENPFVSTPATFINDPSECSSPTSSISSSLFAGISRFE